MQLQEGLRLVCHHTYYQYRPIRLPCWYREQLYLAHAFLFPCCAVRTISLYLFLQNTQRCSLKYHRQLFQRNDGFYRTSLDDGRIYPLWYPQTHLSHIRRFHLLSLGSIRFRIISHNPSLPHHPVLPSEDALDVRKKKITAQIVFSTLA